MLSLKWRWMDFYCDSCLFFFDFFPSPLPHLTILCFSLFLYALFLIYIAMLLLSPLTPTHHTLTFPLFSVSLASSLLSLSRSLFIHLSLFARLETEIRGTVGLEDVRLSAVVSNCCSVGYFFTTLITNTESFSRYISLIGH